MDPEKHSTLPYACSLCGSCSDVCPVQINLHEQLYTFRELIASKKYLPASKRWSMKLAGFVLGRGWLYRLAGRMGRLSLRVLPRFLIYNRLNDWGNQRELPEAPAESFRQKFRRRKS